MERRNFIMGSAVAALSVSALPVAAASANATDRRRWEAAMADLARIEAEDAAFTPNWEKTWKRCNAECEAVPHITLRPSPYSGIKRPVSTADTQFVATARRTLANIAAGKERWDDIPSLNEQMQLLRDTAAEADKRDRQVQAIRDRHDMDRLDDKAEALGDALADAQGVLMAIPAPDLSALRWKLDHLTNRGEGWDSWSDDYVRQVNADIARLLPEGR